MKLILSSFPAISLSFKLIFAISKLYSLLLLSMMLVLSDETISFFISNLKELNIVQDYHGYLFKYGKNKLQTNKITISQINKFFGFK